MVGIEQLKAEESEDTLYRERTSVYEVAIKQIWILFRWQSIDLKDIH